MPANWHRTGKGHAAEAPGRNVPRLCHQEGLLETGLVPARKQAHLARSQSWLLCQPGLPARHRAAGRLAMSGIGPRRGWGDSPAKCAEGRGHMSPGLWQTLVPRGIRNLLPGMVVSVLWWEVPASGRLRGWTWHLQPPSPQLEKTAHLLGLAREMP